MTFESFERRAHADWLRVPAHFKLGIDGLIVSADTVSHPGLDEVFTLGECVTESYPSDFGSSDTTRSTVVLYHGSFRELARESDGFDWEYEIWETLTHELQHHLESLAGDDALGDMDYAAHENFKRYEGDAFDPFFYREGEQIEEGVYRVDDEYFIERRPSEPKKPAQYRVHWAGRDMVVDVDDVALPDADVAFITLVDDSGRLTDALHLVVVREVTGLRAVAALLRPRQPVVVHIEGFVT